MKLKAYVKTHEWVCNLRSHRLRRREKNGSGRPKVIPVLRLLGGVSLDRVVLQVC